MTYAEMERAAEIIRDVLLQKSSTDDLQDGADALLAISLELAMLRWVLTEGR